MFSKNIKKLDVHIVIIFLQNAEPTIRHMIVLIVFGRNETVGQKIMEMHSVLKLNFENVEQFVKLEKQSQRRQKLDSKLFDFVNP